MEVIEWKDNDEKAGKRIKNVNMLPGREERIRKKAYHHRIESEIVAAVEIKKRNNGSLSKKAD